MITKYVLDENDIRKMIAQKFNAALSDVNLSVKEDVEGYYETKVQKIYCEIEGIYKDIDEEKEIDII